MSAGKRSNVAHWKNVLNACAQAVAVDGWIREVEAELMDGEPRIAIAGAPDGGIAFCVFMNEAGEEELEYPAEPVEIGSLE